MSPVVGVALLIAITVILAAVIGGVVLGIGTGGVDTPQAQLQAAWDINDTTPGDSELTISHNGGEPLDADNVYFAVDNNDPIRLADVNSNEDLTAGNSVDVHTDSEFEATEDSSVTVLWEDPNSDSTTVLERFNA